MPATPTATVNAVRGPVAQVVRTGGVVRVTVSSDPPLVAELPAERADELGLARGELVIATWPPETARLVTPAVPEPADPS